MFIFPIRIHDVGLLKWQPVCARAAFVRFSTPFSSSLSLQTGAGQWPQPGTPDKVVSQDAKHKYTLPSF